MSRHQEEFRGRKARCPICKSQKPMRKKGWAFNGKGQKKQRWGCRNDNCPVFVKEGHSYMTIYPLKG